jgi:hypothetical protein
VGDHEFLEGHVLDSNDANKSIVVRRQEESFKSHWLELSLWGALCEIDNLYSTRSLAAVLQRVCGLAFTGPHRSWVSRDVHGTVDLEEVSSLSIKVVEVPDLEPAGVRGTLLYRLSGDSRNAGRTNSPDFLRTSGGHSKEQSPSLLSSIIRVNGPEDKGREKWIAMSVLDREWKILQD